tara:strand:+ start:13283 stop:14185 length:903 start_codon:yes stop_codon:yes gene_type:complete
LESNTENCQAFHLSGIIPVSGIETDFGVEWPDCLMPLAANYAAVERSIVECAAAGCENIWIIANDDIAPLLKYRLGDYVRDPYSIKEGAYKKFPDLNWRSIPIYYVPINPKDRGKIDCYGWGILYGALSAYHICRRFSRWAIPDRYYVSFPLSVYDPMCSEKHRSDISSSRPFYFSKNGRTIADGEMLGFTFNGEDFKRFRKNLRQHSRGFSGENLLDGKYPQEKLPPEKRYAARNFTLDKVFQSAILKEAKVAELPWQYDITDWEGYCEFLGSPERAQIERPSKKILSFHKLNKIGEDE